MPPKSNAPSLTDPRLPHGFRAAPGPDPDWREVAQIAGALVGVVDGSGMRQEEYFRFCARAAREIVAAAKGDK